VPWGGLRFFYRTTLGNKELAGEIPYVERCEDCAHARIAYNS
jgi:hypothetical protein